MTTEKKKISIKFKHLKSAYSLDLYRYTHTYTRIYICIIKSRKREKEIYIFANLKKKNVQTYEINDLSLTEVIDKSV